MKRKKTKWDAVAWTPFVEVQAPASGLPAEIDQVIAVFANSRYQVWIHNGGQAEPFGRIAHLSIKTHDKAARHDWRDLQRIKNELVGPEFEAVEIYPAESRLVDAANQYHLWVFVDGFRLPFGFNERLVADGDWRNAKQRPFEDRPADCLNPAEFDAHFARVTGAVTRRNDDGEEATE